MSCPRTGIYTLLLRVYKDLGDIFLCGDLNSRIGSKADFVENLNLNRYLDVSDVNSRSDIPLRQSCDTVVNSFGHKLLSLCKQHNLLVVNGRLDNGCFSCYKVVRNTAGSSLVDYLITDLLNFQYINEFQVLDLNEYSDHCAIRYSFKYRTCEDSLLTTETDKEETTKIAWDMDKNELFHDELLNQTHVFDCIISDIEKNEININDCINRMTNAMYDICKNALVRR